MSTKMLKVARSCALMLAVMAGGASADSGSWSGAGGNGLWSNAGNWTGGTIADGAGSVASFTGLDLAGDVPVNLDSARALGGLNFADTNPATAGNWILAGSQLDLAGGSTVDVGAMAATSAVTINNVIGGTTGLTKTGAGQLTLAASNLFTGGVRVSGGTLRVNGSVAAQSTQLSGNGTINVQATIGNLAVVAGQAGKVVLRAGSGFLGNTTGPTGIGATGPGASLTVEASFTGGTVSNVDGSWTVGTPLAQVNFVGTGASASTYRLRVNGGGFVTTNWTNTLVNLEKATLTTLTGSLGNRVNLGGLSGNSAGILNGGIGAGGIATYEVGALNTDTTFAGSFTAGRGLNFDKVGTGKLTLSGTLTSMVGPVAGAGLVRVRGGTLALVGATNINAATTVTVETPGVLDVSGSTPVYSTGAALVLGGNGTIAGAYLHDKGTLRPGNAVNQGATLTFANDLTLGGAAAGAVLTQDVTPSLTAGNDKLQVNGNLTVGDFGTVNVNFIGGAASGAYVIAESANAIVDGAKITNAANWVVNWGARGAAPALSIDPTGKKVLMSVSAAGAFSLDWANDGGGAWDVNNTANFVSATGSGAAEKYFQLDAAMFRDSFNNGAGGQTALSGGNKTITLATQVSPSSVTFSNSNVDYTVEGTGKITGTTGLTKEGAGAVILTTVNDYSGPTVIRGGRLQLWSFTADGTLGSGGITLENGGTLSLRNSTTSAFSAALNVAPTGGVLENNMAGLRQLSGSITGSGELVLTTQETTKGVDMIVNQAGFTGKLTVGPAVFFRFNNSGLANAELSIDGAAPAVGTTGAVFSTDIGALSGSGPLYGYLSSAGGGPVTYRIGGKNLPTATFSGLIANNRSDVNTQTLNITKVGSGVQVLSGSLSYTGATTVEAGELQLATSLRSSASLQVLDGAVATLAAGGSNALVTTAINLGGTGVLNTNDNDLVINYGGASPIASLIAFYNGGQIVAAADSAGLPTYLAISEAGDLGITDLGGISVDETTVIGKYTYVGDANLDGQVDALDYERVDLAIGNSGVAGTAQGDLNYDGNVDALDYEQIDLNIGNGVGSLLGSVLVPEPASGALLGLAVGMLSRRNRRRD